MQKCFYFTSLTRGLKAFFACVSSFILQAEHQWMGDLFYACSKSGNAKDCKAALSPFLKQT